MSGRKTAVCAKTRLVSAIAAQHLGDDREVEMLSLVRRDMLSVLKKYLVVNEPRLEVNLSHVFGTANEQMLTLSVPVEDILGQ